jgi:hypothetical protein
MSDSAPDARAYAYHVPSNPYDPHEGEWATLIRSERVQVGDRIDVAVQKKVLSSDGSSTEVVISGSQHEWEVAAIEAAEDDGRVATVRGWRGSAVPVWDGVLVLRRAE